MKKDPTEWRKKFDAWKNGTPTLELFNASQDKTNVQDATKVNYSPSVYVGDSEEVLLALNDKIAAEGKALYAAGRFTPYVKYATDVIDWLGGDFTDGIQMAGNALQIAGKGTETSTKNTPIGLKVTHTYGRGGKRHKHSFTVDQNYINEGIRFGKGILKVGKAVGAVGVVGDIIQSAQDFKNLYEAEKRYKHVSDSVFNSRVIKPIPKYDGGTDDKTYLPEYEYEATVTPQGTSLEKHKRITNEEDWLKYWGNVGAGYVNKALEAAAPYVLNGMSMLMGNPIGALAGIGGSVLGSELGAKISPQASAIGGLAGGFLGGIDVGDVKNLAQIGRISKSVKPLLGEPSDIAAMLLILQNLFDNYTKFRAPFRNARLFPETVGDVVQDSYYARAFGGRDKLLTDLSTKEQLKLAAYDASQSEPIPFRDSNGVRFIHMDDTGPQPVSKAGLVPKDATNSNSQWNSSQNGTPKIWWAKNEPYYPFVQYRPGGFESVPRTYVASEKNLVNNNLDGLRNVYTTEDIVPFTSIDYAILPNMFGSFDLVKFYDKGKSIHINPANKGKFNATKKRTGKTTEQLAHSKNPLTRKRAIFALNSRKWSK